MAAVMRLSIVASVCCIAVCMEFEIRHWSILTPAAVFAAALDPCPAVGSGATAEESELPSPPWSLIIKKG